MKNHPEQYKKLVEMKARILDLAIELHEPKEIKSRLSSVITPKEYLFSFDVDGTQREWWQNSLFKTLRDATPQTKGKLGEWAVREYYKSIGVASRKISRGGDLIVSDVSEEEVKTSFVKFIARQQSFWFNQIRIKYNQIRNYHFVAVFPDRIEVLETVNRDEVDFNKFSNGHSGGTKTLKLLQLSYDPATKTFFNKKLGLELVSIFTIEAEKIEIKENVVYK